MGRFGLWKYHLDGDDGGLDLEWVGEGRYSRFSFETWKLEVRQAFADSQLASLVCSEGPRDV